MKIKLFEILGVCKHIPTGLTGTLIGFQYQLGGNTWYDFQPGLVNPKTQIPADDIWVSSGTIEGGKLVEEELPVEVLGTEVFHKVIKYTEGKLKGKPYSGIAVALIVHTTGCIHIVVQAPGTVKETNEIIKAQQFDIRLLTGKAIKPMTKAEIKQDIQKKPSPAHFSDVTPSKSAFSMPSM